MLHISKTLPLTNRNLQCLQLNSGAIIRQINNRAIIRQICSIKTENVATVRSQELLAKLELKDELRILTSFYLCDIQVDGGRMPGRPNKNQPHQ